MSSPTSNSYRLCTRRERNVPGRTATGTIAGKKLAGTQNIAQRRKQLQVFTLMAVHADQKCRKVRADRAVLARRRRGD